MHGPAVASFGALRMQLVGLFAPDAAELARICRAELIGPTWLRRAAPSGLTLLGLAGWWGEAFDGRGAATNIVMRREDPVQVLPMRVFETTSLSDGCPVVTLR
jgi:hypothetical protein